MKSPAGGLSPELPAFSYQRARPLPRIAPITVPAAIAPGRPWLADAPDRRAGDGATEGGRRSRRRVRGSGAV